MRLTILVVFVRGLGIGAFYVVHVVLPQFLIVFGDDEVADVVGDGEGLGRFDRVSCGGGSGCWREDVGVVDVLAVRLHR